MKQLLNTLKTKNIITVLVMVSLFALVIGISFSAYNYTNSASDNALKSGQISMTYTEPSNTVILKDALPKEDELGKNQEEYFEFSVMSNATTNEDDDRGVTIPYEISISKVDVDASLKQLEDKDVKIYLTKLEGNTEEVVFGPILISELEQSEYDQEGLKIYDTKNKHSNNQGSITTKYRIRFWVDENVDVSNWSSTGEYEYKFKVNVNANSDYLDVENMNLLAKKIKSMYTVENGTAVEDNGYYYLKGLETESVGSDPSAQVLTLYGQLGNVYLYRQEVNNGDVEPVSNIKQVTDTKEYTYNQELLESDLRNYMILSGNVSESEYEAVTAPFGGYVNFMVGSIAGVVDMDTMGYVEGYTIDDIPTLDEAMADETMSSSIIEMFSEVMPEVLAYSKSSFVEMYSDGEIFNEELLNANLELGVTAMGDSSMIETINTNFGSISNYCVAEVNEMIDYDNMTLIEGKTIDDIPKLSTVFAAGEEKLLLTNTYIKLNGILWKILGINKDDTIKLMASSPIVFNETANVKFIDTKTAKYLGYNDHEKTSPFLKLIKGTTLEDLIVKTSYKYEENNKQENISSYASLITYEELKNSMVGNFSYLVKTDNYDISVAKLSEYFTNFDNYDDGLSESTSNYVYVNPVITIKDIEVVGEGTIYNPYIINNEKKVGNEKVANTIHENILSLNTSLNELYLYEDADYGYDSSKSTISKIYAHQMMGNDQIYATGISIDGKCYYNNIEGESKEIEYSGNCSDKMIVQQSQPYNVTTYSYKETSLTITATNVNNYRWQQKVGDEWVDLEDYTGRITGTNTASLTIIPTSYFNSVNYYRCIMTNDYNKVISGDITVNIALTDGEFVYEEIEDTNKYKIISYIGDYNNSEYFELVDTDSYHFRIPGVINGDTIKEITSFTNSNTVGDTTWYNVYKNIESLEIEGGIESIYANVTHHVYTGYKLKKVKFNEGLKIIGSLVFSGTSINEIILPSTIKEINLGAFYNSYITTLTLPEGLEKIGIMAFKSAKLTELEIPSTVKVIDSDAFDGSRFTDLKIYGKTSLSDFATLGTDALPMADGYEPQFIPGTLG